MCGIMGAVAQRDVAPILLEGLRRLEYRGYDSAGVAVINPDEKLHRLRTLGKVKELAALLLQQPLLGTTGIAHTRWATHGIPSEANAHPHVSNDHVAVVHNGIVENHDQLRQQLLDTGYQPTSETDSELIAHLIDHALEVNPASAHHDPFIAAVFHLVGQIKGAYALGIVRNQEPGRIIAVRCGSPLVIGKGIGENFIASDPLALLPVAQEFIYLEEGDIADIHRDKIVIYDAHGEPVEREVRAIQQYSLATDRGAFRHYMLKEIYDQPAAIADCLEGRIYADTVFPEIFGENAAQIFERIQRIQIVACGTSYHAGMVARYWIESIAKLPCQVEIASEYRYRDTVVEDDTLFVTLSQSGETADTLAALKKARPAPYLARLGICNVPESSIVRASDLVLLTHAGPEIGVASTKAFTTQLTSLLLLTLTIVKAKQQIIDTQATQLLRQIPELVEKVLLLDKDIKTLALQFIDKQHALFLGRGAHYPVALEGALKLKEISYIHAEAYPAGELKHGPLALVDSDMPVIAVAPNDALLEKLKSNLSEVKSRGGQLIVFADEQSGMLNDPSMVVLPVPTVAQMIAPIIYTIPLQLLAYHVAVQKGTDVDQPRNLAKAVTVE